jgi:hypothetical protein
LPIILPLRSTPEKVKDPFLAKKIKRCQTFWFLSAAGLRATSVFGGRLETRLRGSGGQKSHAKMIRNRRWRTLLFALLSDSVSDKRDQQRCWLKR